MAEEAFTSELAKMVSHLTAWLSGQADGKPKVFRDSAVSNLTEFLERFRDLNVRSNQELDRLVADAQRIVRGVEPQDLRDNQDLRQHYESGTGQLRRPPEPPKSPRSPALWSDPWTATSSIVTSRPDRKGAFHEPTEGFYESLVDQQ